LPRKILLADDSVTAQNMGRKILVDAGYEVSTVNNGSAALKRIAENKPDLIVLDVYMPGYSGLEVCQRLKEADETSHIPILLTVGKLEPFKPDEARRAKADAHIVKPFEASELLTAIARLEDRMVPQGAAAKAKAKKDAKDGEDSGWKERLRFPSKKKKEEPEVDPEEVGNFREFRRTKGKKTSIFGKKTATPEPAPIPDIPRDITPEELDALSAVAAKLDAGAVAAENGAPVVEAVAAAGELASSTMPEIAAGTAGSEIGPQSAVAEQSQAESEPPVATMAGAASEAKAEEEAVVATPVAAVAEAPTEFTVQAASSEAAPAESAAAESTPAPVAEAPASAASASIEIPVVRPEAAATDAPVAATQADERAYGVVNAASLVETAAPVDRQDEPSFASVPLPEESQTQVAERSDVVAAVAEQKAEAVAPATVKAFEVAHAAAKEEAGVVESKADVAAEETKAERVEGATVEARQAEPRIEIPVAVAENSEVKVEPPQVVAYTETAAVTGDSEAKEAAHAESDGPAPSEEELAEALRLLTPSTTQAETSMPGPGTLAAAGQLLAEEAARNAAPGTRWVAEAVALSAEEAALSLEEEMFRSFSASAAAEVHAAVASQVPAIAAVVESHLAEANSPAVANESAATASRAEPIAESSAEATPVEMTAPVIDTAAGSEQKDSPLVPESSVAVTDEGSQEPPAATFGDPLAHQNNESAPLAAGEAVASAESEKTALDSEAGREDDMGKENGKSSKSTWHQIHPPAAAAKSDAVEAAKQAEPSPDEAPKAMAAAAAASESAATSSADPNAIANIVDSVLADLRPKIVEEIAKKLGKK